MDELIAKLLAEQAERRRLDIQQDVMLKWFRQQREFAEREAAEREGLLAKLLAKQTEQAAVSLMRVFQVLI